MDNRYQIAVGGYYKQKVFDKLKWRTTDEYELLTRRKDSTFHEYDVFGEQGDLILGDLDKDLHKAEAGKDRRKVMEGWVQRYGFLGINSWENGEGETLREFWREVDELMEIWRLYAIITGPMIQGALEQLEKVFFVHTNDNDVWIDTKNNPARIKTDGTLSFTEFGQALSILDALLYASQEDFNKYPERCYQIAAMKYISNRIKQHIPQKILFGYIDFKEKDGMDRVKLVQPCIKPNNLLEALYLQMLFAISDSRNRICPNCGRVFIPKRPNDKYCDIIPDGKKTSCYDRAKRNRSYVKYGK